MKKILYLIALGFAILNVRCAKDNYDEPKSVLTGKIVYQSIPIQLRGTSGAVSLQAYQHGYAYFNPISIYVGQDGTFSANLFDGDYLLVTKSGNGPWVNSRDTTKVSVKGDTHVEFNVTPFFMVKEEAISLSDNTLNVSFSIDKIVEISTISSVKILLNKTQFVDDTRNILNKTVTAVIGENSMNIDLTGNSTVSSAKALYARICVKAAQADQGIYSSVIRLK